MSEWTLKDEDILLSLANNSLSVQEILEYLPTYTSGEIASKLNKLRKQRKHSKDYKIRMEQWYEKDLIDYALKGLSPTQISSKFPDTTANIIIGRLSALKKEGKLPEGYIIRNASAGNDLVIDDVISTGQDIIHIIKELHAGMARIEKGLSIPSSQSSENPDTSYDQDLIHLNNEILDLKDKIEVLSNNELTSLKNRISTIENEISTIRLLFDALCRNSANDLHE